jgi:thiamine-monophosphate kinase
VRGSSTGTARRPQIAERSLIEAIAAELGGLQADAERLLLGIGDDAAIVRAGGVSVTSVDAMIEGVHFRLGEGLFEPADVGHHALAAALSDLAAMGATPGEAYFVLGLPHGFGEPRALELMRAAGALASAAGAVIAGGDVVSAPVLMVSVTAVGWAQEAGHLVSRAGARVGDLVGVTGSLGAAAAALAVMEGRAPCSTSVERALERARRPLPRLAEGRRLAAEGVHAMIDLSDGLAADAAELARRSGVRLAVELGALPLADGVAEAAAELGVPAWQLAATGGEDYELCFCAGAADRARLQDALAAPGRLAPVSWIGEVREAPVGLELLDEQGGAVQLPGYEHRV